jgi:hypothetical protein
MVNDGKRISYASFIADIEVGQTGGVLTSNPWLVSLRWSDTRGASYGNPVIQSMGAGGELYVSPQWQRLGMARDRVFEISWSAPVRTALQSAFIEVRPAAT